MKIAVFGGTFDPVHIFHLRIAQCVLDRGLADRVLLMPAAQPPHKDSGAITPFAVRLRMLRIAAQGRAGIEISDLESARTGKSYTIDTLRELKRLHPEHEYLLLIGSDSLRQLHTWYEARDLAASWTILTYPRAGQDVKMEELLEHWSPEEARKLFSGAMTGLPVSGISSSAIRAAAASGDRETLAKYLHPDVLAFADRLGLYRNHQPGEEINMEKNAQETPKGALEIAELCEKVAYERKAENIIRLDMTGMDYALADQYILCTALSEPHIGAIAERIQRECRNRLQIRPLVCDGTPQSQWMIVDFGSVLVHILSREARAKYQLEDLWGDAPRIDVIARLDAEAQNIRKTASGSSDSGQ